MLKRMAQDGFTLDRTGTLLGADSLSKRELIAGRRHGHDADCHAADTIGAMMADDLMRALLTAFASSKFADGRFAGQRHARRLMPILSFRRSQRK